MLSILVAILVILILLGLFGKHLAIGIAVAVIVGIVAFLLVTWWGRIILGIILFFLIVGGYVTIRDKIREWRGIKVQDNE